MLYFLNHNIWTDPNCIICLITGKTFQIEIDIGQQEWKYKTDFESQNKWKKNPK